MAVDTSREKPSLRAPTFREQVVLDAYREAIKDTLASVDSAADKVLTGALSFLTAYGALVTLVEPEEPTAPLLVGVPFAVFALASLAGVWALWAGVTVASTDEIDEVRNAVVTATEAKRFRTGVAILLLALGIVAAGWALVTVYGK